MTTNEVKASNAGGTRLRKGGGGSAVFAALGLTAAILAGAYGGVSAYAHTLDTFYPHHTINGVDVGGLTVDEAGAVLAEQLPRQQLEITVSRPVDSAWPEGADAPVSVTLEELGYTAERCPDIARRCYDQQRQGSVLGAGLRFLSAATSISQDRLTLEDRDEAVFSETAERLEKELSMEPLDGSYEVDGASLTITKAADGRDVKAEDIREALEQKIQLARPLLEGSALVNCARRNAKAITAQAVHDAVSGEVKNAGYDAATGTIIPEQVGADFNVSAAQKALNNAAPGETITVQADIQYPSVTAEVLKDVLFRDLLGECTTHVGGSAARISNVRLASSAFNGTVMNSGDVFSYNETVGQRTAAKGYKPAPAYVQGETVDEIGGGVCQPSSTLYYACLLSNMEITERYAHRYIPAYITRGMDATVSWGGPDYKFTNNTDYPIKIVATYSKNYLTVQLWGTKTSDTTVKMTYETLSTTPFEEVEQVDPTLAPGARTVKVTPYTGYKVRTYRNVYAGDGTLISSKFEATSDYKSRNRVVLVGPEAEEAGGGAVIPGTPADTTPVTPPTPANPPVTTPTEPPVTEPDTEVTGPAEIPATPPAEPEPPVEEPSVPVIVVPEGGE